MSIFREYDIRGIFGEDLDKSVVVQIGCELGREIISRGGRSVAIGYDARIHSPILFQWLCEGLNSSLSMQSAGFANKVKQPFCTCENFGDFTDSKSSLNSPERSFLENFHKYESNTANTIIVDSDKNDSLLRDSQHQSKQYKNFPSLAEGTRGLVDSRESNADSPQNTSLKIYNLGMIPTPVAYFSLYSKKANVDSSIMITGSHNPPKYNGFKITILKKPFYGDDIRILGDKIRQNPQKKATESSIDLDESITEFIAKNPQIQALDALNEYIDFLTTHFAKLKNFKHKVAFDCGNGVAGIALKSVLKNLNIPHLPLFFDPDGNFPNHHPDPSEDKNLVFLQNAMKENDIKIGIAFDGDADRIGLLSKHYHFRGDELAILFAKQIAKESIKPIVIGEVKCSAVMYSEINKFGNAIMYKTGHSNLKVKLSETNAHLAAEMSGHLFFNDRYFGYDDAIYASLRALELFLDTSVEDIEFFIKSLPQMFSTSEEKIESSDDEKFEIIKKLVKKLNEIYQNQGDSRDFGVGKSQDLNPRDFPKIIDIITIDGIRVVFENGWGLIRASNTTPVLVTRFEAKNRDFAETYKQKMLSLLSECDKNKCDKAKDL